MPTMPSISEASKFQTSEIVAAASPPFGQRNTMAGEPNGLTKRALYELISARLDWPRSDAAEAVQIVLTVIMECLRRGEKVKISGLGSFETRAKKARPGFNLRNGAPLVIAARRVVRFKPSSTLKTLIAHRTDLKRNPMYPR
jgi:nucleoid DNA-binding protein